MLTDYIGKKVQIYPCDTSKKYGIIEDVNEGGWFIRITKGSQEWTEGSLFNYSFGSNIQLKFIDD